MTYESLSYSFGKLASIILASNISDQEKLRVADRISYEMYDFISAVLDNQINW